MTWRCCGTAGWVGCSPGSRAPSTLGTFLRAFTFGHVRQLDAVASRLLVNLAGHTPLLPGADELVYVDIDDTVRQTYGYAKQGAGRGYTGVKGLNALIATVSTPPAAPVIAAARLRKGSTNQRHAARPGWSPTPWSPPGHAGATRGAGAAGGLGVLRPRGGRRRRPAAAACFSITARQDRAVRKAIAAIDDDAWTAIKYTNAVFDEDQPAVDLRRRGRRDRLHRVHLQAQGQAGHRPADRAPGQGH